MAELQARIRPYELRDKKLVRFMIAKGAMEPLTIANKQVYFSPFGLAVWLVISAAFTDYMNWWPTADRGFFGYLQPVPSFACVAVALMLLTEWTNRPAFEDAMNAVLRRPDLVEIEEYYSRSPSSGFWLLEYGEKFVGLIAVDASLDSQSDDILGPSTAPQPKGKQTGKLTLPKGTSPVATIRHFYVEEPYRPAGVQEDLLDHAVSHAFTSDATVKMIHAVEMPQKSYINRCIREKEFRFDRRLDTYGLLRWQSSLRILKRETWVKSQTSST